jgi:hypothetical protein
MDHLKSFAPCQADGGARGRLQLRDLTVAPSAVVGVLLPSSPIVARLKMASVVVVVWAAREGEACRACVAVLGFQIQDVQAQIRGQEPSRQSRLLLCILPFHDCRGRIHQESDECSQKGSRE